MRVTRLLFRASVRREVDARISANIGLTLQLNTTSRRTSELLDER